MSVLHLNEDEVRSLTDMDLALSAVDSAFRKLALDEAENIPRHRCQTDHVMLHLLPAAAKTLNALGFKVYTTARNGVARFQVTLYDSKTGSLAAILEADYLGQARTGAASGIASKKLARADAKTLGVYGAGKQAFTQIEAVCKVRPIEKVAVYSRDEQRRLAFADRVRTEIGVEAEAVAEPERAARDMDIICTATTSREPVLLGEWVSPGTHVNLIGSNFLAKAEADVELFRKCSMVTVDSKEQARLESGDFVAALREGVLNWINIWDFAQVLVGRYPGREKDEDITIFKSLGIGIEDIALAVKVVERARERGIGRELDI